MKGQLRVVGEVALLSFIMPFPVGCLLGILAALHAAPHLPRLLMALIALLPLCIGGFCYGLMRKLPMHWLAVLSGWTAGALLGWFISWMIIGMMEALVATTKGGSAVTQTHGWSVQSTVAWQMACIVTPTLATIWGWRRRTKASRSID